MRLLHANFIILLGLFCHLPTLDQGPMCTLATRSRPGRAPLDNFPHNPPGRLRHPWHPSLPPIPEDEEPYDPLYTRGVAGRKKKKKIPRLPTITEEGESPRPLTPWAQRLRVRVFAGRGGPPITGFAHHNNYFQGRLIAPNLPPPNRGRG